MSAMNEMRRSLFKLYGNLVSVEPPIFDSDRKVWVAQLKSDYPRIIRDDLTNEGYLKFVSMKKLGTIQLTEDFKLQKATPREECVGKIHSFLGMWRERAERIITYASSDKLARISEAKYVFSPMMHIVSNFLQRDLMTHEEVAAAPRTDRLKQYLKLLEELDLATETSEGYTYGSLFTELQAQTKAIEELRIAVLSYVIRERYSTLRDVFKTRQFEPYVHINSCYYRPALEAEKLLYRKPETLVAIYRTVYKPFSTIKLNHFIQSLTEVGAVHHEKGYLYGDEELFSNMLEMKGKLAELAPPKAGRAY